MVINVNFDIFGRLCGAILISMAVFSVRLIFLIKNGRKVILHREGLNLFFLIYVLCLFFVVTFRDSGFKSHNFVLFREMFRYEFGSYLFVLNVFGNLLLFMPYGFFLGYYLKIRKSYVVVFLSLFLSILIEILQLLIGRVFDIDDIVLNTFGGFFGFYFYYILNKGVNKFPVVLKKPFIYNIMLVCLLVLLMGLCVGGYYE